MSFTTHGLHTSSRLPSNDNLSHIDWKKALEIIDNMKRSGIGEKSRWNKISKKIEEYEKPSKDDLEYFTRLTRIYKDSNIQTRTKTYHTKLSRDDEKPPCKSCGTESAFYCIMNDAYFCPIHVVGHDKNESL